MEDFQRRYQADRTAYILTLHSRRPISIFSGVFDDDAGEYYQDPDQVIVFTGTLDGFRTWGASINGDLLFAEHLLWRNELRGRWSKDAVFPGKNGMLPQDTVLVSSLTLSI